MTNAVFLVMLIVLIEFVFFFAYDLLSEWLTKNFGANEYTWRLAILFVNIVVLLEPCRRLAKFLRFTFYFVEKGKKQLSSWNRDENLPPNFFEHFSALAVGSFIAVTIVILVPNGIDNFTHIIFLVIILALSALAQIVKYKRGVAASAEKNVPAAASKPTEDQPKEEEKTEEKSEEKE